ncbi:MAG: macro domain-containing protein [Spirochaetaceae bacterium]|nr:macro domain-containing protein [Spirochaetaceae bacterium]
MSSITIQQKGILDIPADAIVNAANSGLLAGGGVCGVIFQRAGERQLAAACKEIGHCPEGSAVITAGFGCPCKYIIHAVGPVYRDGTRGEAELLYGAYKSSLQLCRQHDLHSVVFPLISAGIFGYPVQAAWCQAIAACRDFISGNPDFDISITFAIPEEEKLVVGQQVLGNYGSAGGRGGCCPRRGGAANEGSCIGSS